MRELDYKESCAPKNWHFWTVVLEKTLESSLDSKEIQPVHPKGNQSWIFIGRTDIKAETPIFGHLMQRADSFEMTVMLGKIEGGRRRGRQRMRWLDGIPTQWTWVWVNSGSWWWTWRPGVLQSMESQRVQHNWVTELNWTEESVNIFHNKLLLKRRNNTLCTDQLLPLCKNKRSNCVCSNIEEVEKYWDLVCGWGDQELKTAIYMNIQDK